MCKIYNSIVSIIFFNESADSLSFNASSPLKLIGISDSIPPPSDKAISAIRLLWSKVPDGWHKNPYAWAGIGCTLVFFALFAVSWVQWHEYREENRRLKTVADKHHVTMVMLNELYPELSVTVGAYEKLVDVVGVDSTLAIFNRQVKTVREEENQSKRQK